MAPLVQLLQNAGEIESILCLTAQHREMLDQVLSLFKLEPHYDLDIMEESQSLTRITVRALEGLEKVLQKEKPDLVLVQGDTTTTLAGSLSAFYHKIPVGHVEAGLRTGERYAPFPEEINRRLNSVIAQLHFAPTSLARENLLREGIDSESIFITGNTVIDALQTTVQPDFTFSDPLLQQLDFRVSGSCWWKRTAGKPGLAHGIYCPGSAGPAGSLSRYLPCLSGSQNPQVAGLFSASWRATAGAAPGAAGPLFLSQPDGSCPSYPDRFRGDPGGGSFFGEAGSGPAPRYRTS